MKHVIAILATSLLVGCSSLSRNLSPGFINYTESRKLFWHGSVYHDKLNNMKVVYLSDINLPQGLTSHQIDVLELRSRVLLVESTPDGVKPVRPESMPGAKVLVDGCLHAGFVVIHGTRKYEQMLVVENVRLLPNCARPN